MANPRQRRKSRSGSHRPVSHSRHAKRNLKKTPPIRGPAILQHAWDNTKTVRQNYAALGLVHDLNPTASGGAEPIEISATGDLSSAREPPSLDATMEDDESPRASTSSSAIPKGMGRIIRDEAGNVLRIELAEEDVEGDRRIHQRTANAEGQDVVMELLEPDLDATAVDRWVTDLGGSETRRPVGKDGKVVQELEKIAVWTDGTGTTISASLTGVGPRHSAHGELGYLRRLVDKYGDDVEKMTKDRKLNPEQRTTGELRRALKRAGM